MIKKQNKNIEDIKRGKKQIYRVYKRGKEVWPNIDISEYIRDSWTATVGDYLFTNIDNELLLISQDVPLETLRKAGYFPLAVVVTPGKHNVHNDCSVSCISLNYLSQSNINGTTDIEKWQYGTITSFDKLPFYTNGVTIQSPSDNTFKDFKSRPCIPTSILTESDNQSVSIDGVSCYNNEKVESDVNTYGYSPSPYLNDGSVNSMWWYANNSNKYSVQRDFNGKNNTEIIVNSGSIDNFLHVKEVIKYYPKNGELTKGMWYIPACGEAGYHMTKFKEVNDSIQNLISVFGDADICIKSVEECATSNFESNSRKRNASYNVQLIGMSNLNSTTLQLTSPFIKIDNITDKIKVNIDWELTDNILINNRYYYNFDNIDYIYVPKGTTVDYSCLIDSASVVINEEITIPNKIDLSVNIVGSFSENTPAANRYVYINGTKHMLDQEFNFNIPSEEMTQPWTYGYSNTDTENTSSFGIGLKTLTRVKGFFTRTLYAFFENQTSLVDISGLADINTESCTNLCRAFMNCSALSDISALKDWNTSKVTNMSSLFRGCSSLVDISALKDWDLESNTGLNDAFRESSIDNISALKDWNVSNVDRIKNIFSDTNISDVEPLRDWTISKATNISYAFANTNISNAEPLRKWDTSKVTDMRYMFSGCKNFTDGDILSYWNIETVTDFSKIFYNCPKLNHVNLKNKLLGGTFAEAFVGCSKEIYIDISGCKINASDVFKEAIDNNAVTTIDSTDCIIYKGDGLWNLFIHYDRAPSSNMKVNIIGTETWDTNRAVYMHCPFYTNFAINEGTLNIESWNTSNIKEVYIPFANITTLKLGVFDLGACTSFNALLPTSLVNIIGEIKNIKASLEVNSVNLTADSAMIVINGLSDEVNGQILSLYSTLYNRLSVEQIAVATAKGWSVVKT